jgi:hypothetical protein
MNVYFEKMKTIINQGKLTTIFTDVYDIRRVSDELVLLESYDLSWPDGIKIIKLDDVTRIRWDSNELNATDTLIKLNNKKIKTKIDEIDISNIFKAVNIVNNLFGYVNIYIQSINNNICLMGEVKEIDDSTIIIHEFGTIRSNSKSYLLLALQDITRIDAGGTYENQILQHNGIYS